LLEPETGIAEPWMTTSPSGLVADAHAEVSAELNVADGSTLDCGAKSAPFVATGSSFIAAAVAREPG
jgi:hypothetical protein